MQSTEEIIAEHTNKIEINTINWVLKLLKSFPFEMAVSEIKKYKEEVESEM